MGNNNTQQSNMIFCQSVKCGPNETAVFTGKLNQYMQTLDNENTEYSHWFDLQIRASKFPDVLNTICLPDASVDDLLSLAKIFTNAADALSKDIEKIIKETKGE